ncbi:MAG TPA: hypothetical protein VKQ73_00930 [Stellaceae bacterium]|nr:hypothetical protein [Stellaceae bacterium]
MTRLGLPPAVLLGIFVVAACSSSPKGSSTLTLNDPYWDRVNVEVVITKRADCDSRADGFVATKDLVMRKNTTERFDVPDGANVCWRHDRDPDNPAAGAWSGWTRATMFPGQSAETDL